MFKYAVYPPSELLGDAAYCTPAFALHEPYVLIVDDDYAILTVLLMLLESEGYAGLGFIDSEEVQPFLERASRAGAQGEPVCLPAVILMDLMMPGLSGYELAAQLQASPCARALPVVVMTADSTVRSISAVQGACDLISKPFQIDVVLDILARYLSPLILV